MDLGALAVDGTTTVTFTVSMPSPPATRTRAPAGANYQWVSTQAGASSTQLSWR